MPPCHPYTIFGNCHCGKGTMSLLRLSQGISSGCNHATPTPIFLELSLLREGELCLCFDLARVFLQGATMPPLHHFFLGFVIEGRVCYSLWYNGLTMLPAKGRQHRRCIIPQAVTHSLMLLKMGKIISRNMLS